MGKTQKALLSTNFFLIIKVTSKYVITRSNNHKFFVANPFKQLKRDLI